MRLYFALNAQLIKSNKNLKKTKEQKKKNRKMSIHIKNNYSEYKMSKRKDLQVTSKKKDLKDFAKY